MRLLKKICLGLLAFVAVALAQPGLSDAAQAALQQGQAAASQALVSYGNHHFDQPLWQEAIRRGQEAVRLAPGRPEPLRFLAQVYTTTKWYSQAWQAWLDYQQAGGELDAQARAQLFEASTHLGYTAYNARDLEAARRFYETAHDLRPEDLEAVIWLGRINSERGDPAAALPYWQEAAARDPGYANELARAEAGLRYGAAAAAAFFRGVDASQNGDRQEALAAFREAARLNPQYKEALVRAGSLSAELGQPAEAQDFWRRVLALDPNDARAAAALDLAQAQTRYGASAVEASREGTARYEAGDPRGAAASFGRATQLNPAYAEAWVWRGRLALEAGNLPEAEGFYSKAVSLEPTNTGYRALYRQVQNALEAERAEAAAQAQAEAERARQEAEAAAATEPVADNLLAEAESPQAATAPEEATSPPETASPEQEQAEETAPPQEGVAETTPPLEEVVEAAPPAEATPPEAAEAAPPQEAPSAAPPTVAAPETVPPAPPSQEAEVTPDPGKPLVLLDVAYTHRGAEEGNKAFSLFEVGELPEDLTSPVNYAAGTLYQRLEVLGKPSDLPVKYQLCTLQSKGPFEGFRSLSNYACSNEAGLSFVYPGVYEHSQPMTSLERYETIDWRKPLSQAMLVLGDVNGNPVDDRFGFAGSWFGSPVFDFYYPLEVRYTAMIVPPGERFTSWP